MEKARYIYSLSDPKNGAVRYVGASVQPLRRYHVHCTRTSRSNSSLKAWIISLLDRGLRPTFCILEQVEGPDWGSRETWWIHHYTGIGEELFNTSSHGGDSPPTLEDGRWARDFDACVSCGRTERRHARDGLCNTCYNRERHRRVKQPDRPYFEWAWDYPACVECGTTDRQHKGRGLCTACYARAKHRRKTAA